jgi:hypothetical protein
MIELLTFCFYSLLYATDSCTNLLSGVGGGRQQVSVLFTYESYGCPIIRNRPHKFTLV